MCNDYRYTQSPDTLREEFSQLKIPLRWTGDVTPNYPPYEDIRPNQTAPILRGSSAGVELSVTPWAWKSSSGKPVFNFRSEGRSFAKSDRCLIPSDGSMNSRSLTIPSNGSRTSTSSPSRANPGSGSRAW